MKWHPLKKVVAAWSGGIDSTAVIAKLLRRGYEVRAVSADLYKNTKPRYYARELFARTQLVPLLKEIGDRYGGLLTTEILDTQALWSFSSDGVEIPMRNKRWIDLIMAKIAIPGNIMNIALGEYVGVDTWLVSDHVPGFDCDHRALSAYILSEYGIRYRLISLQDFGESRYKSDRLRIGLDALGIDMSLTTNCMRDVVTDCGECYKCIERSAAFSMCSVLDKTQYTSDPRVRPEFQQYCAQMRGEIVSRSIQDCAPL
jgi:hypothetical protein